MREALLKEVDMLALQGGGVLLEKAQALLMDYLKDHPKDTHVWLTLMLTECHPPLYDAERIAHYAQHILSYDPYNPHALLFWAYADYYLWGGNCEELYTKLCNVQSDNPQIIGMIEVAKARYLWRIDEIEQCEQALKKSIELCPDFAINFDILSRLYRAQGRTQEAEFLYAHGMQNCKKSHSVEGADPEAFSRESINGFFCEFFSRVYTSKVYTQATDDY